MSKRRIPSWLLWLIVPLGLLIVVIQAVWIFVTSTAAPVHPQSAAIVSVQQSPPPRHWAAAAGRARQIVKESMAFFPGVSVAVGIDGNLVWAEGFGFADLDTRVPVTPNHRFRVGTAATTFTSAAAGLLVEQGRLKLDDVLQTYVPEFPAKQWPVTLRHLMSDTAGVVSDSGDDGPLFGHYCERPVQALPYFLNDPLQFQPGTQHSYSAYSWVLASAALDAAARQPFNAFLKERIFDRLEMRDTVPDPVRFQADDDFPLARLVADLFIEPGKHAPPTPQAAAPAAQPMVTPYFPRLAANPSYGLHLMRSIDCSCYAGAGAFLSTPSDLVRFGLALHGGRLLQPATVAMLHAPQRLTSGAETGGGLGWMRETVTLAGKPTAAIGQSGDVLGGPVAALIIFPEHGLVVAVTSNISYSGPWSIATKIAGAFLEQGTRASHALAVTYSTARN